jgi:two-component system, OmpR family, sensor kinase
MAAVIAHAADRRRPGQRPGTTSGGARWRPYPQRLTHAGGAWFAVVVAVLGAVIAGQPVAGAVIVVGWVMVVAIRLKRDARSAEARLARLVATVANDRDARDERDHDVLSALVAVEGGLRALRATPPPVAGATEAPTIVLLDALAVELSTARSLLAPPIPPVTPEPFDLAELIRIEAGGERARGATIGVDLPPALRVAGSPTRTVQVLRNLLDNARRHAPGATVHIRAWVDGEVVRMRVHDDGPGIPIGERDRVFERGARGATAGVGGSGLGLFVAGRLMADQGGELRLDDRGSGTTFMLDLPVASSAPGEGAWPS